MTCAPLNVNQLEWHILCLFGSFEHSKRHYFIVNSYFKKKQLNYAEGSKWILFFSAC